MNDGKLGTVDDLAAMLRGTNAFLAALAKVWPQADASELLEKAREIEASVVAQELLHQVLTLGKVRVG